jgi:hypothetical protein
MADEEYQVSGYSWTLLIVLGLSVALFLWCDPAKAEGIECYDNDYEYLDRDNLGVTFGYPLNSGAGIKLNVASEITINNVSFLTCEYSADTFDALAEMWVNIFDWSTWEVVATSTIYNTFELKLMDNLANCFAPDDIHDFVFDDDVVLPAGDYVFAIMSNNTEGRAYMVYDLNDTAYDTVYEVFKDDQGEIENNDGATLYFQIGYNNCTDINGKLTWAFPQDDYVLSNSEWNDWNLIYDMDAGDVGDFNLLIVHYTDSNGITYSDYELVSTTTDVTLWSLDRSKDLPDGSVYSQGILIKIDECAEWDDDDCVWDDISKTEIIEWTASSTGYTIFDNPYNVPAFFPATSSSSSDETVGIIGSSLNKLKNVFPLSVALQIWQTLKDLKTAGAEVGGFSVKANTLLPAEMAVAFDDSAVLISADKWNEIFPWWSSTVYDYAGYAVHLAFLLLIGYILWPKAKNAQE